MNESIDVTTRVVEYIFNAYLSVLPALQAFSLVVIGVLLFFVVYMLRKHKTLEGKRDKLMDKWGLIDLSKEKMRRTWSDLRAGAASGSEANMKKAIGDADKLLDEALKNAGIVGKNLDERLAKTDAMRVANIQEVLEAHRLAVRTQKEPTLRLTMQEGWNIIGIYEKALKDLGLLK